MALKISNSIVVEDIEDETGKKIGEIKFDPEDERIMKLISDTVRNLTKKLDEQKSLGELKSLEYLEEGIEDYETLQKSSEDIEKINKAIDLEYEAVAETIENFEKVFGKETMDIITCGSVSIKNITPLLNFISPYIKEYREKCVGKYKNGNSTVFK